MWISHKFLSIFGMISRNENLHLSYACVVCVRLFSHTMQCFNVDLCYSYSSCSCDNIRYNCVVHFVFQECVISVRAHRHKAKKLEKRERRRNINFWAFEIRTIHLVVISELSRFCCFWISSTYASCCEPGDSQRNDQCGG